MLLLQRRGELGPRLLINWQFWHLGVAGLSHLSHRHSDGDGSAESGVKPCSPGSPWLGKNWCNNPRMQLQGTGLTQRGAREAETPRCPIGRRCETVFAFPSIGISLRQWIAILPSFCEAAYCAEATARFGNVQVDCDRAPSAYIPHATDVSNFKLFRSKRTK